MTEWTQNLLSKQSFFFFLMLGEKRISSFRLEMGVSSATELFNNSLSFLFDVFINDLKGPW